MTIDVQFLDSGREPQCKSDPRWPDGKDISLVRDYSMGDSQCCMNLPYPAPRCGVYAITCRKCGFTAAITVAGRPDDPRTVTLPCKVN